MSRVLDALGWSGSGFTVSLFIVTDSLLPPPVSFEIETVRPGSVKVYALEDERHVLGGLHVYTYDLRFDVLPKELHAYLAECLRRACDGGARLAWLAFEGSFDFSYLLADQVAEQIYGVCSAGGPPVVILDDVSLMDPSWKAHLRKIRESLT